MPVRLPSGSRRRGRTVVPERRGSAAGERLLTGGIGEGGERCSARRPGRTSAAACPGGRQEGRGRYGVGVMPKAARVLAALKRDGWTETRRRGSHRVLVKGDRQRIWAYHEGVDLGGPAMARIAKDYGYSLAELRRL
jgi:predicted RNA binding protein YcfA (HicA-like mRNA interferase family)